MAQVQNRWCAINVVPDLLVARAAYARLKSDATVLGLIPRGSGDIRMYPGVAPAGVESPFLTYVIFARAAIAAPKNQPPALITVPWALTAWRETLSQQPLDPLLLACQGRLCMADLKPRMEMFEGFRLVWQYAGPLPVTPDVGDEGKWTRVAAGFNVEIAAG